MRCTAISVTFDLCVSSTLPRYSPCSRLTVSTQDDALLFISYSGKTTELLNVLEHIPDNIPILAITQHKSPAECALIRERPDAILLPAPIHEPEEASFGVCAPTTSTTVAIAVGDMLALTAADALYQDDTKRVFQRNHPGGAIGATARRKSSAEQLTDSPTMKRHRGLVLPA